MILAGCSPVSILLVNANVGYDLLYVANHSCGWQGTTAESISCILSHLRTKSSSEVVN